MATATNEPSPTRIELRAAGRRFSREWVFRHITHTFEADRPTVVLGPNGSGKSTLLQVALGILGPSEGTVAHFSGNELLDAEDAAINCAIAAPYQELIEEFTLREMVAFQAKLRPFIGNFSQEEVIATMELGLAADRVIRHYSSGMKQRVRLGLAILSDTPFLLLDEPCSNLDREAKQWYARLVTAHMDGRAIAVCSNAQEEEHFFCVTNLSVSA